MRDLQELLALLDVRGDPHLITVRTLRDGGLFEASSPKMRLVVFREERAVLLAAGAVNQGASAETSN